MRTIVFAFSLALLAASAHAQTADPRWSAWLGCWELLADDTSATLPTPEEAIEANKSGRPVARRSARVCVTPGATGGVVFNTLVGEQSILEQTIVADGSNRPISDAECRGTQRAEWSADGLRLFSHAELSCPSQPARTISGLALFGVNGQWIDVQAVTIASRDSVRVRRYRRADQPTEAGKAPRGARLTLENIKEANSKVSPLAIEAALIETNASFPLTSKALVDLDRAGVSDSVIDLMVALSYPKAFTVERVTRDDRVTEYDFLPFAGGWGLGYPLWPYGSHYGYADYYWSPYYYSPFGYSYLRHYPNYYGPTYIVESGGGSSGPGTAPESPGRVVNGFGYTRVMPRTTEQASAEGGSSSSAGSTSTRGGGTVSTQGWSSGGSSSGSSGSSGGGGGGSSSGGGGGGRTAVDR